MVPNLGIFVFSQNFAIQIPAQKYPNKVFLVPNLGIFIFSRNFTIKFTIFYVLKIVTIKEIREIFREMLQEHETKQEGMLAKHKKLVLDLISGHQTLLKQRLDQICNNLTSVKADVEEPKESLSFTQNDIDQRFSNIDEKVQSLEKELSLIKENVVVIQTTEPT